VKLLIQLLYIISEVKVTFDDEEESIVKILIIKAHASHHYI
jgi:hypothetical protein